MSVTFSRIQIPLLRMACLLAVTGGSVQAEESQESALSGGFTGAFFFSQSTGPDGVVRMEWFGSILIWVLLLLSIAAAVIVTRVSDTRDLTGQIGGSRDERLLGNLDQ